MNDTPTRPSGEGAWARLRRRKVVQWGVVYVAAAWGLLQGLEYVSDAFQWPPQIRQIALLALLIGLPIVVVLAWYHGDRGEQRIRGTELAIISLLFLVGGGIFWLYDRGREASERGAAQDTAAISADVAVPAPDAKSIAVLPFTDMSPKKDQDYMADGLAEELLNLLAKAPDLKVIARTSSFAFKGEKVPIAEIARKLNVAHVLEGSVRTAGDQIRVTAQLIHAADSSHLWSETYDRKLNDIFAVQDEIADAIAQALQIKLGGGSLTRREGGTQNLEAYQLYLRAVQAGDENTKVSVDAAEKYLERAIELDPNYAKAWNLLGSNFVGKAELGMIDTVEGMERARKLEQHALSLSPELAEAHADLAYLNLSFDWDFAATEAGVKRALQFDPARLIGRHTAGKLYTALGRWRDAEEQFVVVQSRDPLNPWPILNLGITYYLEGRYRESEAMYRKLLELEPGFLWTRIYLAKTLLARGDRRGALDIVQQESDEPIRLLYLPIILHAAGQEAAAEDALQAQIAEWEVNGPYYVAQTYAYRGDRDLAFEWLERAYRQKDLGLIEMTREPLLNNIVGDPRFKVFLRKMKLPEWPTRAIAATSK